jgi:hypothetical protein
MEILALKSISVERAFREVSRLSLQYCRPARIQGGEPSFVAARRAHLPEQCDCPAFPRKRFFVMRLFTKAIGGCAAILWLFMLSPGFAMAHENPDRGEAVGGLRLMLEFATTETGQKQQRHCFLVLQNVGGIDLNLCLGSSLANGKTYYPAAVRLNEVSNGDKPRTLIYPSPPVAGRVDPFVVPLIAGSSYTLPCPVDKYVDSEIGDHIDLNLKDYWISAELTGKAITKTNQDLKGLTLMKFWEGKARSNKVWSPSNK